MANEKKYWLMKTEPESFSIDDLASAPGKTTFWNGVRNYQARNFMRDGMHLGDEVLFYHSSAQPPAVVGTAVVVREAYPDHTMYDPKSPYFDPKATPTNPIWQMVDIRFQEKFPAPLSIESLRKVPALKKMELLRQGSRLSVQPVSAAEFETIMQLAHLPNVGKPAAAKPAKAAVKKSSGKKGAAKAPAVKHATAKKAATKKAAAKRPAKSRRAGSG